MADSLHDRLVDCFAAVFPKVPPGELDSLSVARCAEWDSLASVTLMAVLEQEFGNPISPDDLEMFQSFDLVKATVEAKLDV